MNCFERRPVRPDAYCEPIFSATKAIVEDEGPGARGGDANTKTARGFRALDRCPCEIGDPVALRRRRQAPPSRFIQAAVRHQSCPHYVRAINLRDCRAEYTECHVVSL